MSTEPIDPISTPPDGKLQAPPSADQDNGRTDLETPRELGEAVAPGHSLKAIDKRLPLAPFQTMTTLPRDGRGLDAESYAKIRAVFLPDHAHHRDWRAQRLQAATTTELESETQGQNKVGTSEQIAAIASSGSCHLGPFYRIASWCLVAIDTVFWWIATAQVFTFARFPLKNFWTLLVAVGCALAGKVIGLIFGRVRLTDRVRSLRSIVISNS